MSFPFLSLTAFVADVALPENDAAETVPGKDELPLSSNRVTDFVTLFVPAFTVDLAVYCNRRLFWWTPSVKYPFVELSLSSMV